MDNVGRLKDDVRSSKFMLWLAAKKAQKRIELFTRHHSLQNSLGRRMQQAFTFQESHLCIHY
jgi:hypothetical protein